MKDVFVIYGGPGNEHKISCLSAKTVFDIFDKKGIKYEKCLLRSESQLSQTLVERISGRKVLVLVHGDYGEGGIIQRFLSENDVEYYGSEYKILSSTYDKLHFYKQCKKNKVPFPKTVEYKKRGDNKIEFPLIAKLNKSSSSVGLRLVKSRSDYLKLLKNNTRDKKIILQEFLSGREFSLVLGKFNGKTVVFGGNVISGYGQIYSFKSKYKSSKRQYLDLDKNTFNRFSKFALLLYRKLNLTGLVRFDLREDQKGNPKFLEVNTFPVITEFKIEDDMALMHLKRYGGKKYEDILIENYIS
jgi:D-alanine-D-alanine ligase